jgi:hypothetical protein
MRTYLRQKSRWVLGVGVLGREVVCPLNERSDIALDSRFGDVSL